MTRQTHRSKARTTADLRLKIACIESRRTQRRIAVDNHIPETRLSELVGRRGMPPTDIEKERLAKYFNRPIADLFIQDEGGDDAPAVDPAERTA